jgi:hypothetical protein
MLRGAADQDAPLSHLQTAGEAALQSVGGEAALQSVGGGEHRDCIGSCK